MKNNWLLVITYPTGSEVQFHPSEESAMYAVACYAVDCAHELGGALENELYALGAKGDAAAVIALYFSRHPRDKYYLCENAYQADARPTSRNELLDHVTAATDAWDFLKATP